MKAATLLGITTLLLAVVLLGFGMQSPVGNVVLDVDDADLESFFEPEGGLFGITGAQSFGTESNNNSNMEGGINITINKSESTDPANISGYLVYRILVNNTGGTNAFNMSVIDTYPAQVRFNHSEPVARGALNDTFLIGNLSNRTAFQINITVLIINISNGTVINNTANVSYLNSSGFNTSVAVTENTTASSTTLLPCLGTISADTVLTADLIASDADQDCITIGAPGVQLDCQNHTLFGFNGTGVGVRMPGPDGLEIMQCRVMNFLDGMFMTGTTNSNITNNTILNNTEWGMRLQIGNSANIIRFNQIFENHVGGIYLTTNVFNNSIAYNNITNNSEYGIFMNNSHHNSIAYNNITRNRARTAGIGITARAGSTHNVIYNNTISNHSTGVEALSSSHNQTIRNNTFSNHTLAINLTGMQISHAYGNWIRNSSLAHANTDDASNEFDWNNTAEAIGNFWDDVPNLDIDDSNFNEYGDTGTQYPYRLSNGAFVTGSAQDDGPIVTPATPSPGGGGGDSGGGGGGGGGGGSSCTDACVEGTSICGTTGRLVCAKVGVCTSYVPAPCDPSFACSSGACVPCVATCSPWGPCILGYETRTCTDTLGCGATVPATTRPCAILPVTELPSPLVPIAYGDMFAGTPIACAAGTSTESAISATPTPLDLTGAVPFGYDLISSPFNLDCDGDELDLTLNVPNAYTDIKVLKCTAGSCEENTIEKIDLLSNTCGPSTLSDEVKKELLGTTSVFVPEETAFFSTVEKAVATGDTITSGRYALSVDGTATVSLSGLSFAVPKPSNPSLLILGTPLVIDISDASDPLPAQITLPVPASQGIEKETIAVYALNGSTWTYLGGTLQESNVVSVLVDNLNAFASQGRVILATAGASCGPCDDTEFERVHAYPGARTAVILVHGAFSDKSTFAPMIADFQATRQPFDAWTFAYPPSKSLDDLGVSLADTLASRSNQYDRFYLIGHSAGGLVIQEALWTAYTRGDDLTRVRKAILIGAPTGGSPAIETLENAFNWLINRKTLAKMFNVHGQLIQASVTGIDVPEVPGIDYQVIAGTRPYPFNLDLFKSGDALPKNDGIITVSSAQRVGSSSVDNACANYYEINLSHTDLIDNDLGIRVAERIVSQDLAEPGQALLGLNQYVTIPVASCDPADQYIVVGRPLRAEKRYDPSGCACGNGWCGEGETDVSCPGDCGNVFTKEVFCTTSSVLLLVLLIAGASLGLTFAIRHYYKRKDMPPKWLYAGEIVLLLVLAVILLLFGFCNERPWLWIIVLLILAGFFALLILLERRHCHPGSGKPCVEGPKPGAPSPSVPVKPYAPQQAPRLDMRDLELPKVKPVVKETIVRLRSLPTGHHDDVPHREAHADIDEINQRLRRIQRNINLPAAEPAQHAERPKGLHKKAHDQLDAVNQELADLKRKLNRMGKRGLMKP